MDSNRDGGALLDHRVVAAVLTNCLQFLTKAQVPFGSFESLVSEENWYAEFVS